MKKTFRAQTYFTLITLLAVIVSLSSATYAWFTFSPDTNVQPIEGTIGYGDGNLVIANDPNGPFAETCALPGISPDLQLRPLSTANLRRFYTAREQNRNGISVGFGEDGRYLDSAICGTLYLKSERADSEVYFRQSVLDFGTDPQALAAMRLGLVFTTQNGVYTHIFRLDEMGNTAEAEARLTVAQTGTVIESIDADGRPAFTADPAVGLRAFCAKPTNDPEYTLPGEQSLCTLSADEVARVEYFLYLEGCDENCINAVQGREVALALGFTGVSSGPAA